MSDSLIAFVPLAGAAAAIVIAYYLGKKDSK